MPFIGLLNRLCTGFYDIMYLGAQGADPLPFGLYCHIADNNEDLLGTAMIWAAPITIEDA